jgi:hypothetical protein
MTVNPYITQEYEPQPASTPSTPRAAKSNVGGGRKTHRLAMLGAMIGLLIGLLRTSFPDLEALGPFERGNAVGFFVGQVIGALLLGASIAWVAGLPILRGIFVLLLIGGIVAIVGALAALRERPSANSALPSTNGLASLDSIPLISNPLSRRSIDFARHQEPRRVQFKDEPLSVVLPPNWKQIESEPDHVAYVGSTGGAFPGSVGLQVHPKRHRLTVDAIQDSIAKSTKGFLNFIDSGELTIDEKQAFFVAFHVRIKGQNIREVIYLVPGESKLYELSVACHEPPTASSRNTLSRVLQSLRVE